MTTESSSTDLIVSLPAVPNVATFTDEAEFDKLYDAILQKVKAHVPDTSTKKGRDEIKSLAHKIAKTKVALDKQGLALTGEWRENTKKVNATRTKIEDRLEALQTTVRKPLTEWENADNARIAKHQAGLDALLALITTPLGQPSADLKRALAVVEDTLIDASWEEFQDRAAIAKQDATAALTRLIAVAEKQEADAAELAALRAAQAERERQDAERRAAEEAARVETERVERERQAEEQRKSEIANAAAEAAERAEREAAERVAAAEREATEAKERAEREIEQAKAKALADAQEREQAEADARAAEEAEQRRRDADKEHRKAVNNSIVTALVACAGITTEQAKMIVVDIASGLVPNITLKY